MGMEDVDLDMDVVKSHQMSYYGRNQDFVSGREEKSRRRARRGVFHLASEICALDLKERIKSRSKRKQAEEHALAACLRLQSTRSELDAIWWLADEAKQSGKLLTALASGKSTQRRHCKHCRTPIPPDQNIVEDSAELTADVGYLVKHLAEEIRSIDEVVNHLKESVLKLKELSALEEEGQDISGGDAASELPVINGASQPENSFRGMATRALGFAFPDFMSSPRTGSKATLPSSFPATVADDTGDNRDGRAKSILGERLGKPREAAEQKRAGDGAGARALKAATGAKLEQGRAGVARAAPDQTSVHSLKMGKQQGKQPALSASHKHARAGQDLSPRMMEADSSDAFVEPSKAPARGKLARAKKRIARAFGAQTPEEAAKKIVAMLGGAVAMVVGLLVMAVDVLVAMFWLVCRSMHDFVGIHMVEIRSDTSSLFRQMDPDGEPVMTLPVKPARGRSPTRRLDHNPLTGPTDGPPAIVKFTRADSPSPVDQSRRASMEVPAGDPHSRGQSAGAGRQHQDAADKAGAARLTRDDSALGQSRTSAPAPAALPALTSHPEQPPTATHGHTFEPNEQHYHQQEYSMREMVQTSSQQPGQHVSASGSGARGSSQATGRRVRKLAAPVRRKTASPQALPTSLPPQSAQPQEQRPQIPEQHQQGTDESHGSLAALQGQGRNARIATTRDLQAHAAQQSVADATSGGSLEPGSGEPRQGPLPSHALPQDVQVVQPPDQDLGSETFVNPAFPSARTASPTTTPTIEGVRKLSRKPRTGRTVDGSHNSWRESDSNCSVDLQAGGDVNEHTSTPVFCAPNPPRLQNPDMPKGLPVTHEPFTKSTVVPPTDVLKVAPKAMLDNSETDVAAVTVPLESVSSRGEEGESQRKSNTEEIVQGKDRMYKASNGQEMAGVENVDGLETSSAQSRRSG